jgi:hypothetical protein
MQQLQPLAKLTVSNGKSSKLLKCADHVQLEVILCNACKVAFSVSSPQPGQPVGQVTGNPVLPGDANFLSAAGEEQRCQRDYRRRKCKTAEEGRPDQPGGSSGQSSIL